jgi:uncharacterized protein (TIGR02466 family)
MQTQPELITLFPTVLLRFNLGRSFLPEEISTIKNLEFRDNKGNLTSKNASVLNLPELENLKNFFQNSINTYVKNINKPESLEIYITQSWVNMTTEKQNHHRHDHPNSFLSGVFYVNVDPAVDKIVFHRKELVFPLVVEPQQFDVLNSDSWSINVNNGDLLLFPSTLEHEVPVKKECNKRISISFNTFIKGAIGTDQNLTQLHL